MIKGDDTKIRIRDAGLELLRSRGYSATSMNDIVDRTGVKKGNLYFHYPSKENLAVEVLKDAALKYEEYISTNIKGKTSVQKICEIIDAVYNFHSSGEKIYGCIFGNIALEAGGNGTQLDIFVKEFFARWERLLVKHITKGIAAGELVLREEPAALARIILASVEGGIMLSKVSGSVEPLKQCADFIKTVIIERSGGK